MFKTAPSKNLTVVEELGLTTNLKLLLDAGDIASAPTSPSTKWLDLSGGGYDFWLGTDSGSTSDPTFSSTGTRGGQSGSEYWGTSGFFTYDAANEAWMTNIHKNNALFTVMAWVWAPEDLTLVTDRRIVGTSASSGTGFYVGAKAGTAFLKLSVQNGGVDVATIEPGSPALVPGEWRFIAMAVDEAAGVYRAASGNVSNTFVPASGAVTYSSPSASGATDTMTIQFGTGGRIRDVAVWEGVALTADQIRDYYLQTSQHFGIN